MRLIDADVFKTEYENLITWVSHRAEKARLREFIKDIQNQPTVQAIPVEWLKAYFKKCLSFDDRVFIDNEDSNYDIVIDKYKIFEDWEKENGAE